MRSHINIEIRKQMNLRWEENQGRKQLVSPFLHGQRSRRRRLSSLSARQLSLQYRHQPSRIGIKLRYNLVG